LTSAIPVGSIVSLHRSFSSTTYVVEGVAHQPDRVFLREGGLKSNPLYAVSLSSLRCSPSRLTTAGQKH
jgi:hypothetical protein